MKYKEGDRVRIKSLNWYNENKTIHGDIWFDNAVFVGGQSLYCGCELTIRLVTNNSYYVIENDYYWTDEMIEGLVEEETTLNKWTGLKVELELSKSVIGVSNVESLRGERFMSGFVKAIIPPEGYIFKDENGNVINAKKIVLEKKKKEYPKTYEECLKILGFTTIYTPKVEPMFDYDDDIIALQKLKNCRNAYWKLYGDEMGLGKPWEPDWTNYNDYKFVIGVFENEIIKCYNTLAQYVLAFPTEEMRDAFYENFKIDIERCKELL